ncbi:N-acetyl sugar amidotransferase [Bradyrhizobium sp. S3.9.2]|uniref:N-acetyl sugar amidotransferase n=1 Tax=Bradyrhizobium sp. S3.9.2 TaxID=3156432 RepID=UPI003393B2DC
MLIYCKRCVMPSTKPDLHFDDQGVCSACRSYENRKVIDFDARRDELLRVLEKYRRGGTHWDCIVPVSGGKDSTTQVVRMLQLGLRPLCVTSTTCDLSDIGRHNLDNIKQLGVDLIEMSPNPLVRARLNRIGLTEVGDISWPEHVGIFTIPVRAAVQFDVPLIVWGENSQNEYGGPAAAAENNTLSRAWLEEFGGLLGLRVSDLCDVYGFTPGDIIPYQYPSDVDLQRVGVTGLFLGYYMPWDGLANALIAQANGLRTYGKAIEGSVVDYENLDNYQTGIHDYFKFLKFGFGRATDIACLHIRRGRISREDGLEMVRRHDGKFPWSYLGKSLEDILEPLDLTVDEFVDVCDQFTNRRIFQSDSKGNLKKDKRGNLQKQNYDNR